MRGDEDLMEVLMSLSRTRGLAALRDSELVNLRAVALRLPGKTRGKGKRSLDSQQWCHLWNVPG